MPLAEKPFKPSPGVELVSRKYLSFEDAADFLENGVGSRRGPTDVTDILEGASSMDLPGASAVAFHNVEMAAQSLREDWTTWPTKLRTRRSPFFLVTGRLEVNLHPQYLGNLSQGLRGAAGNLLHRWIEELGCILLGFKEICPVGKLGAVVSTSPFVHFYMHFKAVGFAPKKGDWLMGRLCKVQIKAGMNVTLVGLVNCHIPAERLPPGFRFCRKTGRWLDVTGMPKSENGELQGIEPTRVYVQMLRNVLVDKFQQSGKTFEFRARLGWPMESMKKALKQALLAEQEEVDRKKLPTTSPPSKQRSLEQDELQDAVPSPSKNGKAKEEPTAMPEEDPFQQLAKKKQKLQEAPPKTKKEKEPSPKAKQKKEPSPKKKLQEPKKQKDKDAAPSPSKKRKAEEPSTTSDEDRLAKSSKKKQKLEEEPSPKAKSKKEPSPKIKPKEPPKKHKSKEPSTTSDEDRSEKSSKKKQQLKEETPPKTKKEKEPSPNGKKKEKEPSPKKKAKDVVPSPRKRKAQETSTASDEDRSEKSSKKKQKLEEETPPKTKKEPSPKIKPKEPKDRSQRSEAKLEETLMKKASAKAKTAKKEKVVQNGRSKPEAKKLQGHKDLASAKQKHAAQANGKKKKKPEPEDVD